jgi:hypothetical protein
MPNSTVIMASGVAMPDSGTALPAAAALIARPVVDLPKLARHTL